MKRYLYKQVASVFGFETLVRSMQFNKLEVITSN